jgi:hypothetical protein
MDPATRRYPSKFRQPSDSPSGWSSSKNQWHLPIVWLWAVHFAVMHADEKAAVPRATSELATIEGERKTRETKGREVNQRSNCPTGRNRGEGRKNWVSLTGRCFSSDSQHTTENRYRSMGYTLRRLLLPPLVSLSCSCCCCCCCYYHTRAAVLHSQSCVIFAGKRAFLLLMLQTTTERCLYSRSERRISLRLIRIL